MQLHEGVAKGGLEDHLEWDAPQAAHERCSELEKVKRERDEAKDKLELMERERDQTIVKLTEANDIVRSLTTELEKTKRERDKGTIELEKAKRERDEAETELNKTKDALAHQILGLNAPQSTVQQQSMRRGRPLRAQGPGGTA
jgi:chromosome segregation ATPase